MTRAQGDFLLGMSWLLVSYHVDGWLKSAAVVSAILFFVFGAVEAIADMRRK